MNARHLLRDFLEAFFAFLVHPATGVVIVTLWAIALGLMITGCTP